MRPPDATKRNADAGTSAASESDNTIEQRKPTATVTTLQPHPLAAFPAMSPDECIVLVDLRSPRLRAELNELWNEGAMR